MSFILARTIADLAACMMGFGEPDSQCVCGRYFKHAMNTHAIKMEIAPYEIVLELVAVEVRMQELFIWVFSS